MEFPKKYPLVTLAVLMALYVAITHFFKSDDLSEIALLIAFIALYNTWVK